MAVRQTTPQQRRERVESFALSDHVRQRLRYDDEQRCIDKRVINDVIVNGDRGPNPGGDGDTAIRKTVAGITFKVVVDTFQEVVVTAYPTAFSRYEAITSNRWSQTQIRSVEQRVEDGKTELI